MDPAVLFPVTSSSPCPIYNYFVNAMSWETQIDGYPPWEAAYRGCLDNTARFRFAENFLTKVLKLEVKPKIVFHGKDATKAEAARQRGNRLFTGEDLTGALAAYNESIRNAPPKDKGCAVLALGNRSAVFFRLERYAECIRDIDQAVMLGYPLESVKKLLMRKANAFLALSRPQAAIFVLKKEGSMLDVCSGSAEEISQLDGNMKDYAELLALALDKRSEEYEASKGKVELVREPDSRPKLSTGWEKRDKIKGVELCGGRSDKFLLLSAVVDLSLTCSQKPFAGRDLDVGDVVLVEPAFVSSVEKQALSTNCFSCLSWTDAPYPCSKCFAVVFCSPACANDPKAKLHAKECEFWQSLCVADEETFGSVVKLRRFGILALRMMLTKSPKEWLSLLNDQDKITSQPPTNSKTRRYRDEELLDVFWVTSFDEPEGSEASRQRMTPAVAFLALFITKVLETEYFSGVTFSKKARRRFGAFVMHALAVCERKLREVHEGKDPSFEKSFVSATALHPVFSLFGTSCDANLIGIHHCDVLVVRARRPIRKGEALTAPHVYIAGFPHVPLMERRMILTGNGFDACKCRACEEDWPELLKLLAEHRESSCKIKCPACSHVFGPLVSMMSRPRRFVGFCSKCKSNGREFVALLSQCAHDPESGAWASAYRTVDETMARVRAVRKIFVEPAFALVEADVALEQVLWRRGNKRFVD